MKAYAITMSSDEVYDITQIPALELKFQKAIKSTNVRDGLYGVNLDKEHPAVHLLYDTEEHRDSAFKIIRQYVSSAYCNPRLVHFGEGK